MYTEDITDVEDKYKGKKTHFKLKFKNGKNMHLKIDDVNVKDKWVKGIWELAKFYRRKNIEDRDRTFSHKDTMEISIFNAIMKEHECKEKFLKLQKLTLFRAVLGKIGEKIEL